MAGGEESFATGSPSSQVINRGSPEASVEQDQPVDQLEAVVQETPLSPPAQRIPAEIQVQSQATMAGDPDATVAVTNPKLGGAFPGSKTVKWIGGVPNKDFSAVLSAEPATPLCIRGLDPVSEMKGYNKRVTEGHSIKFKRDDPEFNLMAFADAALNHMQQHGMDTVFYMKGADDASGKGAEEVFTYHTKYTKAHVDKFIADGLSSSSARYDKYAVTALKDSAQWLANSLDESLKSSLRALLVERPTGPQLWMLIVAEVQSDSLRRCTELEKEFKALTLIQFKGENVREYAKKADHLLTQLERDDQLPKTHLLDIIDHLTACTVMEFQVHFMNKRSEVEVFVTQTFGKSAQAIATMPGRIHFRDLLEGAKTKYNNLKHKWGTPNKQEQAHIGQIKSLQAQLDKMNQQLKATNGNQPPNRGGGGNPKGKWAPPKAGEKPERMIGEVKHHYCPKCNNGKGFWNKVKCNKHSSTDETPKGKWAPPAEGESEKKTINGTEYSYCKHCNGGKGRWTKTHTTSEHKTKDQLAAQGTGTGGAGHMAALPPSEANLADLFNGEPVLCQELHTLDQWSDNI